MPELSASTLLLHQGRLMSSAADLVNMLPVPPTTVVSGGSSRVQPTEAVIMASVGADSHLLSNPNPSLSYRIMNVPHNKSPPITFHLGPPHTASVPMPSGRNSRDFEIVNVQDNLKQLNKEVDKLNNTNSLQQNGVAALTLQTVDTPTGQCFLLTNEGSGVVGQALSLPGTANLSGSRVQSATFIPFDRIGGLQPPNGLGNRVTVLPAYTRSSSNDSNSNESASGVVQHKDKRRASHNEVEKRRRDKINQWIDRLRHFLPGIDDEEFSAKSSCSKGGILAKTVDFIEQLKQTNQQLTAALSASEPQPVLQQIPHQIQQLSQENQILRKHLDDLKLPLPAAILSPQPESWQVPPRLKKRPGEGNSDEPPNKCVRGFCPSSSNESFECPNTQNDKL